MASAWIFQKAEDLAASTAATRKTERDTQWQPSFLPRRFQPSATPPGSGSRTGEKRLRRSALDMEVGGVDRASVAILNEERELRARLQEFEIGFAVSQHDDRAVAHGPGRQSGQEREFGVAVGHVARRSSAWTAGRNRPDRADPRKKVGPTHNLLQGRPLMSKFALVAVITVVVVGVAGAGEFNAIIIGVKADKSTVEFKRDTSGGFRGKGVYGEATTAHVGEQCVIKEGEIRLGKPASVVEGKDIENGLNNALFRNATAEAPLKCRIYTADADDSRLKITKIIVIGGN
jgi:hypothetical protein